MGLNRYRDKLPISSFYWAQRNPLENTETISIIRLKTLYNLYYRSYSKRKQKNLLTDTGSIPIFVGWYKQKMEVLYVKYV